jgi:hypothetical protein
MDVLYTGLSFNKNNIAAMNKLATTLILSSIFMTSCNFSCNSITGKKGNGHIEKREISVGSFSDIEVGGAYNIYLIQDAGHSVTVEADENLQNYISVKERNGLLEIRTRRAVNLKPSRKIKIYVSSPEFRKIRASGAVEILSQGKISVIDQLTIKSSGATNIRMDVDVPKINIDVSGAGMVKLTGETRDVEIKTTGAGEVKCFDLKSENVKLSISGAGNADVYASVLLDVKVSGAGSVRYKGTASSTQKISGAGSVKHVD